MGFSPCVISSTAPAPEPAVRWEETDCPLCASKRQAPLVEAPDNIAGGTGKWFLVVQCQECGLCFTNPRPSLDTIGRFYPAEYPPHRSPGKKYRERWGRPFRHWLSWPRYSKGKRSFPGRGRLLDFGCGGGTFLEKMHRRGWQVTGLDASGQVVQRIRAELGINALCGTLPHPDLESDSFDLITMWESLEHCHAPLDVLREAHRLLIPGGKILVAVPNIDSLPFRWFGSAWYGLDLPRHLIHFTPWTLYLMLHRAGFRVGAVQMVRHSSWLRSSARLAVREEASSRRGRWMQRKLPSRLVSWYGYFTQQSDGMMVMAER